MRHDTNGAETLLEDHSQDLSREHEGLRRLLRWPIAHAATGVSNRKPSLRLQNTHCLTITFEDE
jgi:hypothetical protein